MTSVADKLRFEPLRLPPELDELRADVRAFLAETLAGMSVVKRSHSWESYDAEFSARLGARGWIGMTLPEQYGGHGRSALERYVVVEECLVAGAPTGFHWVADRQSGPLIVRYGTEAQKQEIVPRITQGKACFAIGMSEPNSGSDLASLRTRAERIPGGWRVNGTKIWTSNAHRANYMIALFRTDPDPNKKHAGLSQFLIDLDKTSGITPRTIQNLAGGRNFNEVAFVDAELPEDALIGREGEGWRQVTEELAFERSGPERYLSCFFLLRKLIDQVGGKASSATLARIGAQVAWATTLRNMSLSIAAKLNAGEDPALEASVVKDLGCQFEQALPGLCQELCELEPSLEGFGTEYQQVLGSLVQVAPSFSLRGGTPEIMRGIIAKGLGVR
ncbi:MAG: acyl-CoA dehydrogenase family protein [Gammaproteobacteria bacterium]|nr:acyl-CoA dehydrogenase family protein [Gammaproteobacteria bacterium]MCP5198522.1 acyl-CoA dehydrogenase family protein [Gammaproteobacteria bacterium]